MNFLILFSEIHCQKYSQAHFHIFVETVLLGLSKSEIKPGSNSNTTTCTNSENERKASPLAQSLVNHPPASDRNAILFSVPKLSTEGKYCTVEQPGVIGDFTANNTGPCSVLQYVQQHTNTQSPTLFIHIAHAVYTLKHWSITDYKFSRE